MTTSDSDRVVHDGIQTELSRDMGLLHVTMIGVGAMIGAGIFVLTGRAAGQAGPAILVAFAANGLVTTFTALAYAELGSAFPNAGGGYQWVREAMPQPTGFLAGWMDWFAHAVACSLYSAAFGIFAVEILAYSIPGFEGLGQNPWVLKGFTAGIALLFAAINFRGAGETGSAETVVTIAKMIIIGAFIILGMKAILDGDPAAWKSEFSDFMPNGPGGIIVAMGLTFIAFEGYEIIAQCGEEVKNPGRNIPLSIFLSLLIVIPVYLLVAFVGIGGIHQEGVPSWQVLGDKGELAMVEAAEGFMPFGRLIFLIGGLFATMSALNATIYSTSRVAFAMGRDRTLPSFLASVHPTRRTPHWAILVSTTLIVGMAVGLPIDEIASATSVMFLLLFVLVNIALVNLRRNRPEVPRSFRVPFLPVIPILAILCNLVLSVFLFVYRPRGVLIAIGYTGLGLLIYWIYGRRRERVAHALPTLYEETRSLSPDRYRVLAPLANPAHARAVVELAGILAQPHDGTVHVLQVSRMPHLLAPSQASALLPGSKELVAGAIDVGEELGFPVRGLVKLAHNVPHAIIETARERQVNLVVLGWEGNLPSPGFRFGRVLDETVAHIHHDVVLIRRALPPQVRRVVVPLLSVATARLSLEVASILAQRYEARLVLLHVVGLGESVEEARSQMEKELEESPVSLPESRYDIEVTESLHAVGAIVGAIVGAVDESDLLVMGAAQESVLQRVLFGDIPEQVVERAPCAVLLTKEYSGRVLNWFQRFFGSKKATIR